MKHPTRNTKPKSLICFMLVLIFATGIGLMTYFTPKLQEDLEFMASNWKFVEGMTDVINWEGIWNDIKFHYLYTNGRLGDRLVIPVICLIPESVFAIACGIVAGLSVAGIDRITRTDNKLTVKSIILAITMLLIWFPWNESVFLASYSINYLWTSCIAIWIAFVFLKQMRDNSPGISWMIVMCAIMFVAGAWHECIFLTLGLSLLIYSLLSDKSVKTKLLTFILFMFIGFLSNILSGGLQTRVGVTELTFNLHNIFFTWHRLPIPVWPAIPVMVYYIAVIITFWPDKLYARQLSEGFYPIGVRAGIHLVCLLTTASNLILLGFFGSPRSMILGDVFAIIGLLEIYNHCRYGLKLLLAYISSALLALLTLNLFSNVVFQAHLKKAFMHEKQQWLKSDSGVIYDEIPKLNYSMKYPWEMIIADMYHSTWKHYYLANFIRPEDNPKNFIVLPIKLQNISEDSVICLSSRFGVYKTGDCLLYSNPKNYDLAINPANAVSCFGKIVMEAISDNGTPYKNYGIILPFKTNSGKQMYYIQEFYFDNKFSHSIHAINNVSVTPPSKHWSQPPTNYNR